MVVMTARKAIFMADVLILTAVSDACLALEAIWILDSGIWSKACKIFKLLE